MYKVGSIKLAGLMTILLTFSFLYGCTEIDWSAGDKKKSREAEKEEDKIRMVKELEAIAVVLRFEEFKVRKEWRQNEYVIHVPRFDV